MTTITFLFAIFIASFLGVKLYCSVAPRLGFLDRPDAMRKLQKRAVPVGGGVVVYAAFALGAFFYRWLGLRGLAPVEFDFISRSPLLVVTLATGLIVLIGWFDDRWGLSGVAKSFVEFAPIVCAVSALAAPSSAALFDGVLPFGFFFYVFAAIWIFGCVNSVNLLDGADGFVGVFGVLCLVTLGAAALTTGSRQLASACWLLSAAILGFLAMNAPPAKVYFGDSGSLALGFVLGVFSLRIFQADGSFRAIPALCLLTLPATDSACAVLRRYNAGRSVFSPDLSHLHHSLQRRFGRGYRTLAALFVAQSTLCLAAYFGFSLRNDVIPFTASVAVVGALVGFDIFGRDEIKTTLTRVRTFYLRRFARRRYDERGLFLCAKDAGTWGAFWTSFLNAARTDGCLGVRLNFNLPFASVDWQGKWSVRRRLMRERLEEWRAISKNSQKPFAMTFEIPLRLDSSAVGVLRIQFDPNVVEFTDAARRVQGLLKMCAEALLPYGDLFQVEFPRIVQSRVVFEDADFERLESVDSGPTI